MIGLLVLLAFGLFSFFRTLRRHGTLMCRQLDFSVNVFITDEKITRVIRKVMEFWQRRAGRTEKEKEKVIWILGTVLAVFIFLNMTCLFLVLTGYIWFYIQSSNQIKTLYLRFSGFDFDWNHNFTFAINFEVSCHQFSSLKSAEKIFFIHSI